MKKSGSDDLHSVTPYFTVKDADRFIAFVKTVFDAQVVKEDRNSDHTVRHARLRIGDTLIMLNESTDAYPVNVSQMHVRVANADAAYALALRAGGGSLMDPNLRPHGDRMAGITDPCGNIWWIASAT
ncbi:VOC family protein [Hoeflea sp. TYP-13]|uniref:VOC family protein n=1 Tax=Hoeflea sp. TYP-13 TaxID=3230023 RepID=UPI0034C5BC88